MSNSFNNLQSRSAFGPHADQHQGRRDAERENRRDMFRRLAMPPEVYEYGMTCKGLALAA